VARNACPAGCGVARQPSRLWRGTPAQQVVTWHDSPAGCGMAQHSL